MFDIYFYFFKIPEHGWHRADPEVGPVPEGRGLGPEVSAVARGGGGVALAGGGRGGHGGRRTGVVAERKKSKQNSLEFEIRMGPGHALEARKCISMHVVCSGLISISPPSPCFVGKSRRAKLQLYSKAF